MNCMSIWLLIAVVLRRIICRWWLQQVVIWWNLQNETANFFNEFTNIIFKFKNWCLWICFCLDCFVFAMLYKLLLLTLKGWKSFPYLYFCIDDVLHAVLLGLEGAKHVSNEIRNVIKSFTWFRCWIKKLTCFEGS